MDFSSLGIFSSAKKSIELYLGQPYNKPHQGLGVVVCFFCSSLHKCSKWAAKCSISSGERRSLREIVPGGIWTTHLTLLWKHRAWLLDNLDSSVVVAFVFWQGHVCLYFNIESEIEKFGMCKTEFFILYLLGFWITIASWVSTYGCLNTTCNFGHQVQVHKLFHAFFYLLLCPGFYFHKLGNYAWSACMSLYRSCSFTPWNVIHGSLPWSRHLSRTTINAGIEAI